MRVVIQRVKSANVVVDKQIVAEIGRGLLLFVGFSMEDIDGKNTKKKNKIVDKIPDLRIFSNEQGKFDLSIRDIHGEILVVSQFTLYGDIKKGRRPNFQEAAPYDTAKKLFDEFVDSLSKSLPGKVKKGVFGADMEINLCNHGPVTLIIDTDKM